MNVILKLGFKRGGQEGHSPTLEFTMYEGLTEGQKMFFLEFRDEERD